MAAVDGPRSRSALDDKGAAMLPGLRVAHRLLLIYMLSFAAVAYLAYTLVAEKDIAIDFGRKELRGIAYADVVRQALLSMIGEREAAVLLPGDHHVDYTSLQERIAALAAAEQAYGYDLQTAALADTLMTQMRQLVAQGTGDPATRRLLETQAVTSARQLISRIGDDSNLILDPDLDSYYTMSVVMLRLPQAVADAIALADEAVAVNLPKGDNDESQVRFLLKEGAFNATITGLTSDIAAAFRGNPDGTLRRNLEPPLLHAESTVHDFSQGLRAMAIEHQSVDANSAAVHVMLRQVLGAMDDLWREGDVELRRLLQHRIDGFYYRMAVDLGTAALVWLASLGFILVVARQITGPIRELSRVAERIRYGKDYSLRARYRASGEVRQLIDGFNTMLDRLQGETAREQERIARDRAAAAQRQLIEAIPIVISVTSEVDHRILFANAPWPYPLRTPDGMTGDPRNILALLYPEDRDALIRRFQLDGSVDGFEARCRTSHGEPYWILIGSRAIDYQGEPARLIVSTPINDRKRAEAGVARRSAVLDAITYAATWIIGAADWRPAMPELLSRLGIATDVSRVFMFEIHPAPGREGLAQSCRFSWTAPGFPAIADEPRYQNDPISMSEASQFGDWFQRRARGEVIQVTLSQTEGEARRWFEETSTYSMLSVPILIDGMLWGSLGFDDCRSERIWDEMEVDLLKTAAALVASAVQRAKADDQLRQRDRRLVEAQRIGHVGSWEFDFETNEVICSDEGWRIFGLEPGHRPWSYAEFLERLYPDDRARIIESNAAIRVHGGTVEYEYRIVRPDGEIRSVNERAEAIRDAAGRPDRLLGTIHDITELKATEARLRESEERYKLAAQGTDVGLFDWDVRAASAYFSPRVCEILRIDERTLGTSIAGLFDQFLPEDRTALQQHLDGRFATQRRRFDYEVRLRDTHDGTRWMAIRGLIVYAEDRPIRLVGSLMDVSERRQSQEALIRQREALYQSEKMAMFGTLLAGVAHELNNPLTVVTGQIVLLQQTTKDPIVARRAERIRNATDRCARIVRTFLAMARHRQPEPKPVRLGGIVEAALDLLAFQLRSANVGVELKLAADVPMVTVDADQMHQVVTNLIVNAQHALGAVSGQRILRISTWYDSVTERACLSVADNGPGVPAEIRTRIFDPFYTTKPSGEGTGIGLALCSSIVRSYGGRISVSDTPQGGATFTIELPLSGALGAIEHDAGEIEARRDLSILVVEDEREISETLAEILSQQGFKTEVVGNGREALDRIAEQPFDLVISDLRMPVLDGPGLYHALVQGQPEMIRRLVFITGDSLSTEIQAFLRDAKVPCLEKPFQPEDVLRLVDRVAQLSAPEPAGGMAHATGGLSRSSGKP
jgi:PAS domain S-box-containing protein